MSAPNLAACQLDTWAENAVKFKLKLSKTWKRKPSKNNMSMECETKCGKFCTYFSLFYSISADFFKTLTHVCNLYFRFCYCLNAHHTQGAPSLNLILITQNINYLKTENIHWSFTLYSSIFYAYPVQPSLLGINYIWEAQRS